MPDHVDVRSNTKFGDLEIYLNIFLNFNAAIIIHDLKGKILKVNNKFLETFGYSDPDISLLTVNDLLPKESQKICRKVIDDTLSQGSASHEVTLKKKNQDAFPAYVYTSILEIDDTKLMQCVLLDITELKQAQERFELIVESNPSAIVMIGEDSKIKLINSRAEGIFGYDRSELLGKQIEILMPKPAWGRHVKHRKKFTESPLLRKMGAGRDLIARRKDGSEFPVEIGLAPIHTENGLMILASIVDITERKKAEEVLKKSHDELEQAVRERTSDLSEVNEQLQSEIEVRKKTEKALEENLGQLSRKNRYEKIINVVTRNVHQSIELQTVLDNAVEAMRNNIDKLDIASIYLIEGEDIVVKAQKGFTEDYLSRAGRIPYPKGVTWKTAIEETSRYVPDVDLDNSSLGPAGKDMGFKCYLIVPLFIDNKVVGTMAIVSFEKNVFDYEELKLLEIISKQIGIAIRNARYVEALGASEQRYRTLFTQSPVGVYIFDKELKIIQCNKRMAEILQSSRDVVIGFDMKKLKDKSFMPAMEKAIKGESSYHEDFYEATSSSAKLWLSLYFSPLLDSKGNVVSVMGVVEDITKRKKVEEALQVNLEQLSKKSKYEEVINAVSRSIHQSLEIDEIFNNTVEAISKEIKEAKSVVIFIVEGNINDKENPPHAVMKASRGYSKSFVNKVKKIPYPKGSTWKTIIEGDTRYVPDTDKDDAIGPAGREFGTKSYLSIPLNFEGTTVGCIHIHSSKKNGFSEDVLKLFEIVTRQLETAINKANKADSLKKSEESLRKNLDQLSKKQRYEEIISTVTGSVHKSIDLNEVLKNAVEALNKNVDYADNVSIYLVEGDTAVIKNYTGYPKWFIDRVANIPKPKGFTWKTLIEGKPLYCGDVNKDTIIGPAGRKVGTKSYASMPIKHNDTTIGCININSRTLNAFNKEEINLLEIVSQQIDVAINNAKQAEALKLSREKLIDSEEHYRLLVETTDVIPWEADPKTFQFTYIGPQAEKLLGYSIQEWYEEGFWPSRLYENDRDRTVNTCILATRALKDHELEYRILTKEGDVRWIYEMVSVIAENGEPKTLRGFMMDITDRKRAEIQLIQSREQLRKLATRMQSIREEEIARVARGIHDDLGQLLAGLKIELSLMGKKLSLASNGGQLYPVKQIKSISELIDMAIFRVQEISTELRPAVLDTLGLIEAIKFQSKKFESHSGIHCKVDIKTNDLAFDQERSIAIYRVLQESLTNIARHANATKTRISMKLSGGNIVLEVKDNGRGIKDSDILNPKSVGILGMKERVLALGGDLKIKSIPKKGTIVSIILPLINVSI
ncbi:MAG: PAS domain S-box protein [Thermodesulfobacteriota bacterium]